MNEFLKPFQIRLKILSPIHIGSGDRLQNSDFIADNDSIYILDQRKLLDWISHQPNVVTLAEALKQALQQSNFNNFLKQYYHGELRDISAYQIPFKSTNRPREILTFIKTADILPYIPGTSIKGALRSAWFRGRLTVDQKAIENAEEIVLHSGDKSKPKASDKIQSGLFSISSAPPNKIPNYDINRVILIRDSDTLNANQAIQISSIRILSVNQNKGLYFKRIGMNNYYLELYVETLKPGLETTLSGVFQSNLFGADAAILGFNDIEELFWRLPEYCRRTSFNLMEQEADFYRRHRRNDIAEWYEKQIFRLENSPEEDFILPLGWGSGFDSKTITDLLSDKAFGHVVSRMKYTRGLGKPGRDPNAQWLGRDDSPKSRKVVVADDGSLQPLGWVAMHIHTDAETEEWYIQNRRRYPSVTHVHRTRASTKPVEPVSTSASTASPNADTSCVVEKKPQKELIPSFDKTPSPGDCFEGEVFADEDGEIFLIIPGLDPDAEAYGVIRRSDYPLLGRKVTKLNVEVVRIEKEVVEGYWKVICRPLF